MALLAAVELKGECLRVFWIVMRLTNFDYSSCSVWIIQSIGLLPSMNDGLEQLFIALSDWEITHCTDGILHLEPG